MKPRNFDKKLFLNKHTVAHLEKIDLSDVKGGATRTSCDDYTQCPVLTCFVSQCIECP